MRLPLVFSTTNDDVVKASCSVIREHKREKRDKDSQRKPARRRAQEADREREKESLELLSTVLYEYCIILTFTILLSSCSKSPQEKLIGYWELNVGLETMGLLVNADGTVSGYKDHELREGFDNGTWELNDGEPLVLKIFVDGKPDEFGNLTFINDDEFVLTVDNRKIHGKRLPESLLEN